MKAGNERDAGHVPNTITAPHEENKSDASPAAPTRKIIRRAELAILALLCMLSLGIPAAYAVWSDTRLLASSVDMPTTAGAPDEQAQNIPVLYGLYRKRCLSGATITALETATDTVEMAQLLEEKTKELQKAGVLPVTYAEKVRKILRVSAASAYGRAQDGFAEGSYYHLPPDPQTIASRVTMQWHEKTGRVVSFYATVPTGEADAQKLLAAYRTYLGVDTLEDWQTLAADGQSAACWSQAGQVYLFCTAKDTTLSLGAVSLTAEEFELSFR